MSGGAFRWLRRRLGVRPPPRVIPEAVRPRAVQPPLPTFGLDVDDLRRRFRGLVIDDEPEGALAGYANQDLERFLRTVELVPEAAGEGLEIGANPYFTTMLLAWFRPGLALSLTNFFGPEAPAAGRQRVRVEGSDGPEERWFDHASVNLEASPLPFADGRFDVALYCEVLEHMTGDPVATLRELHRVLRPGGHLVLTTPNAVRLENVTRAIGGLGIADQYSGHGPYGRHNREYTVEEVRALLGHCGFEEELLYTADVHDNHAALHVARPARLVELVGHRRDALGQYIFSRWRRTAGEGQQGRPAWLYRSYPDGELSTAVPLAEPRGGRY